MLIVQSLFTFYFFPLFCYNVLRIGQVQLPLSKMSVQLEDKVKSPKTDKDLTDEQKFKLVELVEKRPALWDPRNKDYKKKSAENWISLSEDFKLDFTDVDWTHQELQKKWASLSTYHTSVSFFLNLL